MEESPSETQPPTPPSPPSVRRVGGGFEYASSPKYSAAVLNAAAYQTYKALPSAGCCPYTVDDVRVVSLILRHAETACPARGTGAVSSCWLTRGEAVVFWERVTPSWRSALTFAALERCSSSLRGRN